MYFIKKLMICEDRYLIFKNYSLRKFDRQKNIDFFVMNIFELFLEKAVLVKYL